MTNVVIHPNTKVALDSTEDWRTKAMMKIKARPVLPPLDPLQRYGIEEAILYLRTSRKTLFDDIREGRLATIKEGKRRFVPGTEIIRRSSL